MRHCRLLELGVILLVAAISGFYGCGDDDEPTTPPTPVTAIDVTPTSATVEIGQTVALNATVEGGDDQTVDWYVNDVLGGNASIGVVTSNSPATYTAPDTVPDPAGVVVTAVSTEDVSMVDSCIVTIQFTTIHVDATGGDDETGSGSKTNPVSSITRGLEIAQDGMTVLVAPGLYDAANGETFPLILPAGVALVGEDWEGCVVRCDFPLDENLYGIDIRGPGCHLRKFTLEQDPASIESWIIGVYAHYRAASTVIDSIRVLERPDYSAIRIWYIENTVLMNCYIVVDDGLRESHGVQILGDADLTWMLNCTVKGFHLGTLIQRRAIALLEGNVFEDNNRGLHLGLDGNPEFDPGVDLGGGVLHSEGGNIIRNNLECGLQNESTRSVHAIGNTWGNDPPVEGEDYCNPHGGRVVWR